MQRIMTIGADQIFIAINFNRVVGHLLFITGLTVNQVDNYLILVNQKLVVGGLGVSP